MTGSAAEQAVRKDLLNRPGTSQATWLCATEVGSRGMDTSAAFLALLTVASMARSLSHLTAPEGSAHSIARIDIDLTGGVNLVATCALWGASQLVLSCVQGLVIQR